MNPTGIFLVLLFASFLVAALGGLGIAGFGRDSRGLDARPHSSDRPDRSLLS